MKKIGIILGSGLNKFEEELSSSQIIVEDKDTFHKLKIVSGKISGKEIILFSGRRHFYEGYNEEFVLKNINLAKEFGIDFLIVSNAAGGLNLSFKISDLMLITSHLNFLNKRIPVKQNSSCYDNKLISQIRIIAAKEKINLRFGSYCCSNGPMYETKSEIRFLNKFNIDAVGMSTVPEILFANKLGIKTLGISCITNLLNENSNNITHHDEVLEAGKNAYKNFSSLLKKIILFSNEIL